MVPLELLRTTLDRALKAVSDEPGAPPQAPTPEPLPDVPAWQSVEASRRPDRPGVGYLLRHGTGQRVSPTGTRIAEGATTLLALARFGGQPAVLLGQQPRRRRPRRTGGVAGGAPWDVIGGRAAVFACARHRHRETRIVRRGRAGRTGPAKASRCLAELVTLDTPTVSVLLGQGSGGPALAMVPADRVLATLHGWLHPLPRESAPARSSLAISSTRPNWLPPQDVELRPTYFSKVLSSTRSSRNIPTPPTSHWSSLTNC